ncbi:MAG: hypothetical protein ACJAXJ_001373 [Colwellia sp.]
MPRPIKDIAQTNQTIPAELKNAVSNTDQELLSQFDDKRVEQLLHQQFASLITVSSQPTVLNYHYSDEELALRTVLTSQQEGLFNNENSDELMGRIMVADLVDNMITTDPRYQGLGGKKNNTMGAGISKLADFDANFSFLKDSGDRQPKSSVILNQETTQKKSGKLTAVNQSKMVNTHFNYQDYRPDNYDKTENYNIGTAVEALQLVGLDQQHKMSIDKETYQLNPETNQYDLMMELTEQTKNGSNIRLIEDIWLETKEDSHTMNKKERIGDDGKSEDFKKTHHHSHNKLMSLIGDLEKLADNKDFKRDYHIKLGKVNFFMDKKV